MLKNTAIKTILLLLAFQFISCNKNITEKPVETSVSPGYKIPETGILSIAINNEGAFVEIKPGEMPPEHSAKPFPLALAVTALQPIASTAVLAVNQLGLFNMKILSAPIEKHNDKAESVLLLEPISEGGTLFKKRTIGSSWHYGDNAYFLLFTHPVFGFIDKENPSSILIMTDGDNISIFNAEKDNSSSIDWDNTFAVFPVLPNSWLAQYRSETIDKVFTDYAIIKTVDGLTDKFERQPITRSEFETMAAPLELDKAPNSLKEAAMALNGPLFIEAALPDGSIKTFVRGDSGEATPAWASIEENSSAGTGLTAVMATDDWRVALVYYNGRKFERETMNLTAPVPGAKVMAAAMLNKMLILLWEKGNFPDISYSGFYVIIPESKK